MRSKVIKNKGHLNKAWAVWQVNKWTKIWTRTIYYICTTFNIYFHIFHLKWKQIQIIITICDWNQNLISYDTCMSLFSFWVDRVFLWYNFMKIHTEKSVHLGRGIYYMHHFSLVIMTRNRRAWRYQSVIRICNRQTNGQTTIYKTCI